MIKSALTVNSPGTPTSSAKPVEGSAVGVAEGVRACCIATAVSAAAAVPVTGSTVARMGVFEGSTTT